MKAPVLQLVDVTRRFPGVLALDDVSFDVLPGEVHALVGENGAGKSTLINLVSGVLQPDSGHLQFAGTRVNVADPVAARRLGIATVHQEADFFPTLSVAENMALLQGLPVNRLGLIRWDDVHAQARRAVDAIGEPIDVGQPASQLSIAHRHMVQIAAAVQQQAHVVILDEPTSALTAVEAEWLFAQIDRMKENSVGIVYISHRQEEVLRLADRITVLRDGRRIWTKAAEGVTTDALIQAMVGREVQGTSDPVPTTDADDPRRADSHTSPDDAPRLRVRNLNDVDGRVCNVSFDVRAGEIVGVYGLVGAGRTELAHTIFGIGHRASGIVEVDGLTPTIRSPRDALGAGIAYVPEDRLRQGICRSLSLRFNTVISTLNRLSRGWFADRNAEREAARNVVDQLAVRHRSLEQPIGQLSGGNQQKVVLGRWLLSEPKVLILDEPTRGIDVGAKAEIHQLLRHEAERGTAVVMISSELPEVLQHSDRILVLRNGELAASFDAASATAMEVAAAALPQTAAGPTKARRAARLPGTVMGLPLGELGLLLMVIVLAAWLGLTSDGFFQAGNLTLLLADIALWTILGLAAATVIVAGGIDISVGSLLALAAACAGLILKQPMSPAVTIPLAIGVALLVGTAGGLVNGATSLLGRVHPIVVTLGMMILYRGLVIALLRGQQISYLPQPFGYLAIHAGSGFRGAIVIGALAALLVHVVLSRTRVGRHLYAIGSSPTAARLVGISPARTWLVAFGIGGLLAGLAGVIELSSSMQMQAQLANGWELQAIAVAVIGGFSITGGRGHVVGVVLGSALLRLVHSALVRWEISGDQVRFVVGGMILVVVLLDLVWRRWQR